ncbi:hamartin isoform X2 [Zophobas morio]|uniref:hamartin isoform X2 n=1 Tax=Zophobas morio TaxID=2755281 RepID=UPI00308306D9
MSEIFQQLESNNKEEVEAIKQKILEQFISVRDSWLVNGLYDYYLSTNSANTIVVLVNIKEPHHQYLFDRLSDSIAKSSKTDVKVQALTLLGHIVRSQPTWLYRLSEHHLLKELLKLLKEEVEILPLISALLVLIVLIPMIPYSMGELLNHIFDIFSRLASWNCNPGRLVEEQMIHMQVALYALFLRLYGMFPCNFLAYLRTQYKDKNKAVFIHTIKPMLETVKMNPSLVTTSKDNETTSERWRRMAVHDVIVECERFSLDVSDTFCAHDSCQLASGFRSRSGTANSSIDAVYFQSLKNLAASMSNDKGEYFTPSMAFNPNTPPVGGVSIPTYVPQPEFTHDENVVPQAGSSPPEAAIEATPETTPVIQEETQYALRTQVKSLTSPSQPQSPIRKEKSPFNFSVEPRSSTSSFYGDARPSTSKGDFQMVSLSFDKSPVASTKLKSLSPTSPQKIRADRSPLKSSGSSVDPDDYVNEKKSEPSQPALKQSDSVLHESEDSSENIEDDRSSPCTAGGLHMPNSKSMKDFTRRVQRLRHHSQCTAESDPQELLSGSSPEMDSAKVRRANSCPEMKKSPVSSVKDNVSRTSRTLDETDEESNVERAESADRAESAMSNGVDAMSDASSQKLASVETQTENFWPMPYEHLFLGIFPTLGVEVKSSPGPGTSSGSQERYSQPSINEVLDKYVETAIQDNDKDNIKGLKNQLKLVHQQLLFERHRREIHAFKNRRFLADAKNTQVLEEHNSALRDQVQLQQVDIDALRHQLERIQKEREVENRMLANTVASLEDKCKTLECQNKTLQDSEEERQENIENLKSKCLSLSLEKQKVEGMLVDALAEVKFAKEQAAAGDKGRAELENVTKQLVLIGELQLKYKERLDELTSLRRSDQELELLKESYNNEIKTLHQRYREKVSKLEACINKIGELEQIIRQNEETISLQKRTLNSINDETEEKVKILESKYQTQLAISRSFEEKILEMYKQLEMSTRKPIRSPDTSSCQEVQVPSDKVSGAAALSQRSSPLSCSLTSSDGSLALVQPDARDVKGLQALVDEESPVEVKPDTPKDSENQPSTSGTKK